MTAPVVEAQSTAHLRCWTNRGGIVIRAGIACGAALLALSATAGSGPAAKRQAACGISFEVPQGWKVRSVKPDPNTCMVVLSEHPEINARPEDLSGVFGIHLQPYSGTEESVCQEVGLCGGPEAWFFSGRGGGGTPVPIRIRSSGCCRIIQGTRETGSYDDDGYRGTAEILDAVVLGPGCFAEVHSTVDFDDQLLFDRVLDSLRFEDAAGQPGKCTRGNVPGDTQ